MQTLLLIIGSDHKTPKQSLRYIYFSWSAFPIPKLFVIRVSSANINLDYSVRSKLLLNKVSDTNISLDQFARYRNYSWSEFLVQKLLLIIGSDHKTPKQSLRYIYFSWSAFPIPKLFVIRVSSANINLDYSVRSKLLLTKVSDTNISLDQFARYRNYSWWEFLMQTLLLIIVSDQNHSWPESPIPIFLLISVPDTKITPDQSLWCNYYSWL